jgi:hypothetical protein
MTPTPGTIVLGVGGGLGGVGATNKTDNLIIARRCPITVSESINRAFSMTLTLDSDVTINVDDNIYLQYNTRIFGGLVQSVKKKLILPDYYEQEITAQGYYRLTRYYPECDVDYAGTERDALTYLCAGHYSTGISVGPYVDTGESIDVFIESAPLEDCINMIAQQYPSMCRENAIEELGLGLPPYSARIWWIDDLCHLHYHDWLKTNWETGLYTLSDAPDNITSFPYKDLVYEKSDSGTVFTYPAFSLVHCGSCKCWQNGFRVGQKLVITNTEYGWNASEFLITDVRTTIKDGLAEFELQFESYDSPVNAQIIRVPNLGIAISTYIPVIKSGITPGVLALATTKYAPALKLTIPPGVLANTITTYAPTVTVE